MQQMALGASGAKRWRQAMRHSLARSRAMQTVRSNRGLHFLQLQILDHRRSRAIKLGGEIWQSGFVITMSDPASQQLLEG